MLFAMKGRTPDLSLPHITICGLGAVRSYSRQEKFSHVISIWGVGSFDEGPDEVRSFFPASEVHVVRLDDIEVAGAGAVTKDLVREILDFGSGLSADDRILVHCLAGVSRSPGVAFALACQFAGPGNEAAVLQQLVAKHPWIKPNRRVVYYSDELLQREGRMNAAVSAIYTKFMGQRAAYYSP
jgi:predicted protein tyrosine phosphatase